MFMVKFTVYSLPLVFEKFESACLKCIRTYVYLVRSTYTSYVRTSGVEKFRFFQRRVVYK
jgi:hypothetical protein